MLRVTRQTDLGIVLLTSFCSPSKLTWSARELGEKHAMPLPTVSKILKILARAGMLTSVRGQKGGYVLALTPDEISVAAMVSALEGTPALTECVDDEGRCDFEARCPTRGHWLVISRAVRDALDGITLREMACPMPVGSPLAAPPLAAPPLGTPPLGTPPLVTHPLAASKLTSNEDS